MPDRAERDAYPIRGRDAVPVRFCTDRLAAMREPTFVGYSLGKWLDNDGDGRSARLEIETRHGHGPRT